MTGTFNRFWSDLDLKASGWCRNTGAGGGWQSLETFNCFELMFHSESWLMMVMALHDSEYSTQPDILIQYIYIYIFFFFFKLREAHLGRKCLKMAGEIEYLHLCCGSKLNFVLGLIQSAMTRQKKWWLNYTCGLYACVLPLFGCTAVWSGITGGLPAALKRSGTCCGWTHYIFWDQEPFEELLCSWSPSSGGHAHCKLIIAEASTERFLTLCEGFESFPWNPGAFTYVCAVTRIKFVPAFWFVNTPETPSTSQRSLQVKKVVLCSYFAPENRWTC